MISETVLNLLVLSGPSKRSLDNFCKILMSTKYFVLVKNFYQFLGKCEKFS